MHRAAKPSSIDIFRGGKNFLAKPDEALFDLATRQPAAGALLARCQHPQQAQQQPQHLTQLEDEKQCASTVDCWGATMFLIGTRGPGKQAS